MKRSTGSFTPSNPPGSQPKPGFIGPPSPPREGEPTKFTPGEKLLIN